MTVNSAISDLHHEHDRTHNPDGGGITVVVALNLSCLVFASSAFTSSISQDFTA